MALAVTVATAGCSFVLVQPPRPASKPAPPPCTRSFVWPVVDAAAGGVATFYIVRGIQEYQDDRRSAIAVEGSDGSVGSPYASMIPLGLAAAAVLASAALGVRDVVRCRATPAPAAVSGR